MDTIISNQQSHTSAQITKKTIPPFKNEYQSHKVIWTVLIGLLIILMLYVVILEILFLTGNSSFIQSSLFTSLAFYTIGLYTIVLFSLAIYIALKDVEKNRKVYKISQEQISLPEKIYLLLEIVLRQLVPRLTPKPLERYSGISLRAKMVAFIIGFSMMIALFYFISFLFFPNP